jgi:ABC-2 type transport system ATP-binding protein
MAPLLETHELRKNYGRFEAVRGLNLRVRSGSVCAFLGQNGAGKSSTLRMLMGMTHPSSGTGRIFGLKIDDERDSLLIRERAAFVAEDKRLYDYMTVGQGSVDSRGNGRLAWLSLCWACRSGGCICS